MIKALKITADNIADAGECNPIILS
ncbi:hypothetical protein VCHC17A1_3969A, partial [Vibrio cholerae HC-17A1]